MTLNKYIGSIYFVVFIRKTLCLIFVYIFSFDQSLAVYNGNDGHFCRALLGNMSLS